MVTSTRSCVGESVPRVTENCRRYTFDPSVFCRFSGPAASRTPATSLTLTLKLLPLTRGTAARCNVTGWPGSAAESKLYRTSTATLILALGVATLIDSRLGSLAAVGLGTAEGSVGAGASGAGCAGEAGASSGAGRVSAGGGASGIAGATCGGDSVGADSGTGAGFAQPASSVANRNANVAVRNAASRLLVRMIFISVDRHGQVVVAGCAFTCAVWVGVATVGAVVHVDEVLARLRIDQGRLLRCGRAGCRPDKQAVAIDPKVGVLISVRIGRTRGDRDRARRVESESDEAAVAQLVVVAGVVHRVHHDGRTANGCQ